MAEKAPPDGSKDGATHDRVHVREVPDDHALSNMDANELQARALQAMLAGDMETHDRLDALAKKAAATDSVVHSSASTEPTKKGLGKGGAAQLVDAHGRSVTLSSQAAASSNSKKNNYISRSGKDGTVDSFYGDRDNVSLQELLKRERVEGVTDYDKNFAKMVAKQTKFRERDDSDDDEEALRLDDWEDPSRKAKLGKDGKLKKKKLKGTGWTAEENARREGAAGRRDARQESKNLSVCPFCREGMKWSYQNNILAQSENVIVALEHERFAFLPGEVVIFPVEHIGCLSVNDMDEDIYQELRNWQKALCRYFSVVRQNRKRSALFVESVPSLPDKEKQNLGLSQHCVLRCYPIDSDRMGDARIFFQESLKEIEDEFERTRLKATKTVSGKGVRGDRAAGEQPAVAKRFPYFWVDFGLEGGLVNAVDERKNFPRNFAKEVLCSALELDFLTQRGYAGGGEYEEDGEDFGEVLEEMRKGFAEWDWTKGAGGA